jgi:hypothetical protein
MMEPPGAVPGLGDMLDLGHGDGIDMRPTLLRVLTDLYLQRSAHTPDDERYYTELALRLIDAADVSQRAALAVRLARYPSAPRAVVARLARDTIEVAAPLLSHAPCLGATELAAIARECGEAHAGIIATRTPPAIAAEPMPAAEIDTTAAELSETFFSADAQERRLILIALDYSLLEPPAPPAPLERADAWRLETAALAHQTDAVVHELERGLGLARGLARRIVEDAHGEPFIVAAKALGLPSDVLQRMLLFLNPRIGQSVDRVYQLAQLYGEISTAAARRLVAIWRHADERASRPPRHEPVAWRTAAENARRTLSEVSRRSELARDARSRRSTDRLRAGD